jgi:hypothetical protein
MFYHLKSKYIIQILIVNFVVGFLSANVIPNSEDIAKKPSEAQVDPSTDSKSSQPQQQQPIQQQQQQQQQPQQPTVSSPSESALPRSVFSDDSIRRAQKGDEESAAHLRLFYKSNSPVREVSNELEHRFFNNYPSQSRYESNIGQNSYYGQNYGNNNPYEVQLQQFQQQYQLPQGFRRQAMNIASTLDNQDRNRHTMLNLHYHGNSVDGLSKFFT